MLKDTHREKAPSNKTPALTKSTDMGIWIPWYIKSTLYKSFLTETKSSKNKVVTSKIPFFVIGPYCTHHSICLNIDF